MRVKAGDVVYIKTNLYVCEECSELIPEDEIKRHRNYCNGQIRLYLRKGEAMEALDDGDVEDVEWEGGGQDCGLSEDWITTSKDETFYKFKRNDRTYYIVEVPKVDSDEATVEIEGRQVNVELNPNLCMTFEEVAEEYEWMVVVDGRRVVDTFASIVNLPVDDPSVLREIVGRATAADDADVVKLSDLTYAVLYWTD